ncbi:MAG: hypothetical protein QOK05_2099 [Chloroflexota bacterium]|nr:hypothetical protein [Chloroflexota bacterium]
MIAGRTGTGGPTDPPARRGWSQALFAGLLGFLSFRVATELIGLIAAFRTAAPRRVLEQPASALEIWNHWDVGWFSNLARQGYLALGHVVSTGPNGYHDGTAFPPAMPFLMRAGGIVGLSAEATGLVVSSAALVVALVLLFELVSLDHGARVATWTLVLLLAYPFAFFLGTAYAESLVLLGTVGAWLGARHGRWWLAGAAVALALLAKIVFILLLVPLSLEVLGWDGGVRVRLSWPRLRNLAALWLPPLAALGGWMVYLQATFGQPLRFLAAQRLWGRSLGLPVGDIAYIVSSGNAGIRAINAIDTAALLLLAAMTVYVYRRVRRAYGVMLGAFLLVFVGNTSVQSNGRHLAVLFPIFIGLALLAQRRRWIGPALVLVQLPLAVALVARFATGHWAG